MKNEADRQGRAGRRWVRGAVATAAFSVAAAAWAAYPHELTEEELFPLLVDEAGAYRAAYAAIPGKVTIPKTINVGGTVFRIYYDPTHPHVDIRMDTIAAAAQRLKSLGYQLPSVITVLLPEEVPGGDAAAAALPIGKRPTLVVGEDCAVMDHVQAPPAGVPDTYVAFRKYRETYEAELANSGWLAQICFSTARKAALEAACTTVAVHEMCHLLHDGQSGEEFWWSNLEDNQQSPDGGWSTAAPLVSGYAGRRRNEFVAEVCAGLVEGYTYPQAVMDAYHDMGGPRPGVAHDPIVDWDKVTVW